MKKKYYKVVSDLVHKFFYSAYQQSDLVEYKIGEWVSAPGNSRLFVFDSLKKAHDFINRFGLYNHAVFECQIVGGIEFFGESYPCQYHAFWEFFNKKVKAKKALKIEDFGNFALLSTKAILCKKVKLINKIA